MSKVYVGNISWGLSEEDLRERFSQFGQVLDVIILKDRETGRSRGFGFITFDTEEQADAAIQGLNDQELGGRNLKVNKASNK